MDAGIQTYQDYILHLSIFIFGKSAISLLYISLLLTPQTKLMAKATATKRQHNTTDLQNLSQRDRDFLTLETQEVMKKYSVGKQGVYDRKFALNKKMRAEGLSIEDVLNTAGIKVNAPAKKVVATKLGQKRGRKPKQEELPQEEKQSEPIRDIVKYEKPVPVVMKPLEINFGNFSIKLNGVPKNISVNPDTNAIEIDL